MKTILFLGVFAISSTAFSMSEDCSIATDIFDDAGSIMAEGMEMAVNDGETLKNTTVTHNEFSAWYKHVYPKKISKVAKKYNQYKTVSSDNPIYLGMTSILEANNFVKSLDIYMQSKDDAGKELMMESKERLAKSYYKLVEDCGKRYDR
ncbi:hypothetical protein AB7W67_22255 [Providencia rettgeri]|uniref:hypothetical protein n=1 Tax=Providencia sp. PROV197 TaxID=2949898 RepID=UPI00234A2602|nr:hypothetical protein [Providencia sp. PROV197]